MTEIELESIEHYCSTRDDSVTDTIRSLVVEVRKQREDFVKLRCGIVKLRRLIGDIIVLIEPTPTADIPIRAKINQLDATLDELLA